jgi:hypothetical protein
MCDRRSLRLAVAAWRDRLSRRVRRSKGQRSHATRSRELITMATGTSATCGQEDIPLLFRKFLRDHLTDAKDPYSERCPGKTPVSLPPPRQPGPKRRPSAPASYASAAAVTSASSAAAGSIQTGGSTDG